MSRLMNSNLERLLLRAPRITTIQYRYANNNRHRDPKYRTERGRKTWKIDLPDFDKMRLEEKNLTPDQVRSKMKEKGVAPPRSWEERTVYSPCTMMLIDPYKPGDDGGKSSSLVDKLKSPLSSGKDLIKQRQEISQIRAFEGEEFDLSEFAKQSVDIYVKAHQALAEKDNNHIFDYVTEHCFPVMTAGLERNTIIWKYLGEIEKPEAVHVRSGDLLGKGDKYAQITVRMHTKQILAIYDRHGRLILGSPTDVKEVHEFVVFEKYLANEYGQWRIHHRM